MLLELSEFDNTQIYLDVIEQGKFEFCLEYSLNLKMCKYILKFLCT